MNSKKRENILALSPQDRYGYLIRKVADFEEVWLVLDNDKYVTLSNNEHFIIPVWPEREFAELMLSDDWEGYKVENREIYDFLDWLDTLEKDGYKIAGFPDAKLRVVVVSPNEMKGHLIHELQQYK